MASIWGSHWQLQSLPIQPLWSSSSAPSASATHPPPWRTPPKHGTHAQGQTQLLDLWCMCRGETALAVCTASMAVVVARGRRVPQPRQISLHATEEMRAMRSQVETLRSKMLSLQSETKHTRVQQQPEVPALRKATVTDDQSAALEAILLSEARAEKLMQELEAEDVRSKSLTEKLEALKAEQGAELQFTSTTQVEELVEELEAQESKVGTLKEALKEEVEELADEAENFEHKALLDASLLKVDEVEPPQGALPEDDLMRDIAELKAELADAEKRRLALQRGPATRQEKENEARKGGRQERVEKEKETGATTGEAQVEATAGVAQTEARPSAVAAGPDNDKMQLQQQQQHEQQQTQQHHPISVLHQVSAAYAASFDKPMKVQAEVNAKIFDEQARCREKAMQIAWEAHNDVRRQREGLLLKEQEEAQNRVVALLDHNVSATPQHLTNLATAAARTKQLETAARGALESVVRRRFEDALRGASETVEAASLGSGVNEAMRILEEQKLGATW
mmetsp:Transcript_24075/g.46857  ORF Transcript_24075/g.46857 Transcript_24075/m.46857 type:complete len:510 (-) Transcript_24075:20-1549(-)